jgi:hypothetical protein
MPQRVTELHSIMPIRNLQTVKTYGILSHNAVKALPHADVSLQEVQDKRSTKAVPNGLQLHDYANLYFCARNPMMYKRKEERLNLCVLSISIEIFKLAGVVFTDRNAACSYVRFYRVQDGIAGMNFDMIYADDWTHPNDERRFLEHKAIKCAEVLVPNVVGVQYISGAYVYDASIQMQVASLWPELPTSINQSIFFG